MMGKAPGLTTLGSEQNHLNNVCLVAMLAPGASHALLRKVIAPLGGLFLVRSQRAKAMSGKGFASGALSSTSSGNGHAPEFGGFLGGTAAMIASFGWPAAPTDLEVMQQLPKVLPAVPPAPTLSPPFAAARGGAEGPAAITLCAHLLEATCRAQPHWRVGQLPLDAWGGPDLAPFEAMPCLRVGSRRGLGWSRPPAHPVHSRRNCWGYSRGV